MKEEIIPDPNDVTNFAIKTGNYQDNATIIETTGTAEQSEQDKNLVKKRVFQL